MYVSYVRTQAAVAAVFGKQKAGVEERFFILLEFVLFAYRNTPTERLL